MKAYSTDLRERVVAACDARDGTREQIAARFPVSVAWVRKLLRPRRDTGSPDPKPHGGGRPPAFDAEAARRLREAVRADDDAAPGEPARAAGASCRASAVHRSLARLGVTRKKVAAGGLGDGQTVLAGTRYTPPESQRSGGTIYHPLRIGLEAVRPRSGQGDCTISQVPNSTFSR